MITVIAKNFNIFHKKISNFQNEYDLFINSIDLSSLHCSCHHTHCLSIHAYYTRTIRSASGKVVIRVLRVKCSHCNRTHAIMPSCIVPYSQILLTQLISIVHSSIKSLDTLAILYSLEDAHIRYINKQYQHFWKQRIYNLKSFSAYQLSTYCFQTFKKQFMQIRNVTNIAYFTT